MNFIDYCIATKNYSALDTISNYSKMFASNPGITDPKMRAEAAKILKKQYNLNKKSGMGGWRSEIENKFIGNDPSLINAQSEWKNKQALRDAKVFDDKHPNKWGKGETYNFPDWHRNVKKDKSGNYKVSKIVPVESYKDRII